MDAKNIKKIISMIRDKAPQGFEMLYNDYFRFMFGIAYSVLKNENDCYDVISKSLCCGFMHLTKHFFPWTTNSSGCKQL